MFEKKRPLDLGKDFFLYGLSFLLLMEWLLPLPRITDTGFIHVFVFVTIAYFVITFLQLPVIVSSSLKFLVTSYGIFLMFFQGPFFSKVWITLFVSDLWFNVLLMIRGEWYALTDMFRSFLFLVLLAIMSYLLFYWIVQARRILFFLVFTIMYVAVIDTFTVYDATYAIIRTFIIGFLLLGLISMYRVIEQEKLGSAPKLLPVRLAMMLALVIVVSTLFGFLLPKPEPQWADPVPVVRAAVGLGTGTGEGMQQIGYGDNDQKLGGGFIDNDTPVFYAAANRGHYWRGETKDYYTGNGWDVTTPKTMELSSRYDGINHPAFEVERLEAEVAFAEESLSKYEHLFYPGDLLTRNQIMNVDLSVDQFTGKAETSLDGSGVALSNYRLNYVYPSYILEELRKVNGNDPDEIIDYYTQIPGNLPERVTELAEKIVSDMDNRYDRAKAIERFLSSSDFTYETEDVPVPGRGQDYVDQFLFETQRGYCGNFSTAMVVLLRTVDVPARWVKGFTQGTQVDVLNDGRAVYQVTNSNAHSWVEVYFPDVGWVPFEPTRGFLSAFDFIAPDRTTDDPYMERLEEDEEEASPAFSDLEDSEETTGQEKKEAELDAFIEGGAKWSIPGGGWILLAIIVTTTLIGIARNKKIVQFYLLRRFKGKSDSQTFIQAYERLLWFLTFSGYKRNVGETLREYAKRLDAMFGLNVMNEMTVEYERIIYGQKSSKLSWDEQKNGWELFVRKIIS
ncbi:transglutaminase TgpA family protein [Bacillus solitudinis]|uniref:transglutaminase TgpA family protein n=1 Tax=Bacillus solitudinis TaxID=2014074 RepID=UPI001D0D04FD|nr:transglutaminaseTgpA domain-containing protein [Bacillus solitudinis]